MNKPQPRPSAKPKRYRTRQKRMRIAVGCLKTLEKQRFSCVFVCSGKNGYGSALAAKRRAKPLWETRAVTGTAWKARVQAKPFRVYFEMKSAICLLISAKQEYGARDASSRKHGISTTASRSLRKPKKRSSKPCVPRGYRVFPYSAATRWSRRTREPCFRF